jgi:tetratricopeptide (TPR) repeat protein
MVRLFFHSHDDGTLGLATDVSAGRANAVFESSPLPDELSTVLGWKGKAKTLSPRFLLLLGLLGLARLRSRELLAETGIRSTSDGFVSLADIRRLSSFQGSRDLLVMRRDITNNLHVGDGTHALLQISAGGRGRPEHDALRLNLDPELLAFAGSAEQSWIGRIRAECGVGTTLPEELRAISPPLTIPSLPFVGRQAERKLLEKLSFESNQGTRQAVFLSGEAGSGKSRLVAQFCAELQSTFSLILLRAACIQQQGPSESFSPIVDGFRAALRGPIDGHVREVMRTHAPTWSIRLRSAPSPQERGLLERRSIGVGMERMRRELMSVLEVLATRHLVVFVLEDVHWADPETLEFIRYFAAQHVPARILLMATYRPGERLSDADAFDAVVHAIGSNSRTHRIQLKPLTDGETSELARALLPSECFSADLGHALFRRCGGNPLFLSALLHSLSVDISELPPGPLPMSMWLEQRLADTVPDSLRGLLLRRLERLSESERTILGAATICGDTWGEAEIAAALELPIADVEAALARILSFRDLISIIQDAVSRWPDGTLSARYRFHHALLRDALVGTLLPTHRVRYHLRVAVRMELAFEASLSEVALEIAHHFQEAKESQRAIHYLQMAARRLSSQFAAKDSLGLLTQAESLIPQLEQREQIRASLSLREHKIAVLRAMGDPLLFRELETQIQACRKHGELGFALRAMLQFADEVSWFDPIRAQLIARDAVRLSESISDQRIRRELRGFLGYMNVTLGHWTEDDANQCLALLQEPEGEIPLDTFGRAIHMLYLNSRSYPAERLGEAAVHRALQTGNVSQYYRLTFHLGSAYGCQGTVGSALRTFRDGLAVAQRNGHHLWTLLYQLELSLVYSWALCPNEAHRILDGIEKNADDATRMHLRSFILPARAMAFTEQGDVKAALELLADPGLVSGSFLDVRFLVRYLSGICLLHLGDIDEAERQSTALIELAEPIPQRSMAAGGYAHRAWVLHARGSNQSAIRAMEQALLLLRADEPCMTTWRVLASACTFFAKLGQTEEAQQCYSECVSELHRVRMDFDPDEPLRAHFESHPKVQRILSGSSALSSG